ncbi:hypothetical protein [Pseudomonas viridiflava]|uniref:hypothetical protein n=1 Tax=Pseudomonas viridiflava TaxID=33069 RepID=UPI0013CEDFB4|nr:hypothetical protein [Pseudomonas viridiflava]
MKRSDFYALMAVLWFIAASVKPEQDWAAVASMAFFAWYAIASAVYRMWLERRKVAP